MLANAAARNARLFLKAPQLRLTFLTWLLPFAPTQVYLLFLFFNSSLAMINSFFKVVVANLLF